MNHYQLMLIFNPNLTEQEEKDQLLQVEDLLKQQKATIHLIEHWGKRKLAYNVKKHRQGVYEWIYCEMEPSGLAEVDRKLKMWESVLRFMIVRMEKAHAADLSKELARRAQVATQAEQPQPAEIAAPPPAAVIEETPAASAEEEPAAEVDDAVELTADEDQTEDQTEA